MIFDPLRAKIVTIGDDNTAGTSLSELDGTTWTSVSVPRGVWCRRGRDPRGGVLVTLNRVPAEPPRVAVRPSATGVTLTVGGSF